MFSAKLTYKNHYTSINILTDFVWKNSGKLYAGISCSDVMEIITLMIKPENLNCF